jgi:hypothetical protein
MSTIIANLTAQIRHRWRQALDTKDAGYTTETVLITALLVALALLAVGLIAAAVTSKAQSINLG